MTTLELYRKHKSGDISREKFLYEVRRDNNLPFITNLTSYTDAVQILKNKGIVTEETKEAKADEAVKAEVKAKAPSDKKPKELHIDQANPYEYRHGLQFELDKIGEYTDEALEKAKEIVLKNLAKDANFYSTLLNQEQSPYKFKAPETDAPGMQAKADGYLKKELKKDEKANVKDNLGKKEEGKVKPKGVKVMPDKGVEGKEKTIKEGIDDKVKDAIESGKIKPEEVKAAAEKAMKGDSTSLIALMAGLPGLSLSEDTVEEGKANKYISVEIEGNEQFPMLNKTLVSDYLKSVIDPEEIESVDVFMDDEEGFDESSSYFFDGNEEASEKDVEDWAKQEMSYYLFSKPDEFPGKENMEEGLKKGDTVEYEGNKYKIGSFDTEANLVYLNTLDGKPAEDSKGSYLKVHKSKVKEGIKEHHNDPNFPGGKKIYAMLDKVADEWGKDSDIYNDLEDAIVGWSDRNGELTPKGKIAIKALLSNWDMLDDYEEFLSENIEEANPNYMPAIGSTASVSAEDEFAQLMSKYDWYYEMSDDPRTYDRGVALDKKLRVLGKQIGTDKAVTMFNAEAPSDRKVNNNFFMEGKEDKHAKLKEILKKKVKEAISAAELIAAKQKGQIVKIPKSSTTDIQAAERAKANYSTYE